MTIEATELGGGLSMLTGRGGNLALSVDDQFAPLSAQKSPN